MKNPSFKIKLEEFLKEFPWLLTYVDAELIDDVKVSRISADFIQRSQALSSAISDSPEYCPAWFETLLLLDEDGKMIVQIGFPQVVKRSWFGYLYVCFRGYESKAYETVEHALVRLGEGSGKVMYALSLRDVHSERYTGRFVATVYKPPQGFTLRRWADQVRQKERNALTQKLAAINEEVQSSQS